MSKFKSPFYLLDKELFKAVNRLTSNSNFQRVQEEIASLSEDKQKILNYTLTFAFILAPLAIAFSMFITNMSMKSDLEIRKEILASIHTFDQKNNQAEALGRTTVSPFSTPDQAAFEKRIDKVLESSKIIKTKVTTKSFKQTPGEITKSEATISFKEFTTTNLFDMLIGFLNQERMKVTSLNIKKNTALNLLEGRLEVVRYGK